MLIVRRSLALLFLLLCAPLAFGQAYTSVAVFGDSLSDTGNVAHLTQAKYSARVPGPAYGYTDGRFTDGKDTLPAATLYTGVWIEQLAATFTGKPPVTASLDGGTNYAYGYAFTGAGTSTLSFPTGASVQVENLGQQVTDYLAVHPTVPTGTLVVVWAGSNDILNATQLSDVTTAATSEMAAIQRLVAAGATNLLVCNVPPLGAIPRLNTTTFAAGANTGAQAFNAAVAAGVATLSTNTKLTVKLLDVYTLFSGVAANPAANGLTDVTTQSQGKLTANPDKFLFWDDLHPTTAGHHLIAVAAAALLTPPSPSYAAALSQTSVTVMAGAAGSSTVTITPANGFAGNVTLACGTLPAYATCAISPATLTFTSTSSTAQTATVNLRTNNTAAAFLLPLAGLGALFARRRRLHRIGLLALAFAGLGFLGLSGCADSGKTTAPGSYTVPITVTPASGTATTLQLTLVVQ